MALSTDNPPTPESKTPIPWLKGWRVKGSAMGSMGLKVTCKSNILPCNSKNQNPFQIVDKVVLKLEENSLNEML
jgi:hypothetical protein